MNNINIINDIINYLINEINRLNISNSTLINILIIFLLYKILCLYVTCKIIAKNKQRRIHFLN